MLSKRHPADKRRCKERGNIAEIKARLAVEQSGKQVKTATSEEDRISHIDFFVIAEGKEVPIQVKSKPSEFPNYICVELKGTTREGSLYRTKAHYNLFETDDHFLVTKISEMREWVAKNISDRISDNKIYAIQNKTRYLRRSTYGENHLAFIPVAEAEKFPGSQKLLFADQNQLGISIEGCK